MLALTWPLWAVWMAELLSLPDGDGMPLPPPRGSAAPDGHGMPLPPPR